MNSLSLSGLIFACIFGGAMLGAVLGRILPAHHLSSESKEIVRLGTGLVGTMTALLLGLLVASAKNSYDADKNEIVQISAKIMFLDRLLASYGPESLESRQALHRSVETAINRMWPTEKAGHAQLDPSASASDGLYRTLQRLTPKDENQQAIKTHALSAAMDLGQMRWLLYEQGGSSLSTAFLVVVVSWLILIFISFGLFAPLNTTVVATLMISALSVSCSLFLIFELDQPFDGLIRIPSASMRDVLLHLGQ